MSLRLPQSIQSTASFGGASPLEAEVAAEKAAALRRAGRRLQAVLATLLEADDEGSLWAAAEAAHDYMIQRELCGLIDHRAAVDNYDIPRAVIAKIGVRRSSTG